MDFSSDNSAGASENILAAIVAANGGSTPAYGADPYCAEATRLLETVFERPLKVFLMSTGTAANALALGAISPPFGAIFCHDQAHVMQDECGAPEMFTGGAKLVGLNGRAGKISAAGLKAGLVNFPRGLEKQVQSAALSLSQVTECGTIYTHEELSELAALAHNAGLTVHMDGARFANALVSLGGSPAEMSWKAGIDVLSFGATKNGALACEAVIFFDSALATTVPYRRKRSGHSLAKGRFLGAQMTAYLKNGHWLDLAARANGYARRLADGLAKVPGVRMPWPCQANEVFAILPQSADAALKANGAHYYPWIFSDDSPDCNPPGPDEVFVRLVTSFATKPNDIDCLIATVSAAVNP